MGVGGWDRGGSLVNKKSGSLDFTPRSHVGLVFVTFIKQIWLRVNLQGMSEIE